jgi:arylsulfatase A
VEKPLPSEEGAAGDSHNVLPAFLGKKGSKPIRDSMVSHSADGIFAMRQGDWKYIEGKPTKPPGRVPKARAEQMTQQLYNLRGDPREEKNVIDEHREIAAKLQDLLSTQRAQGRSRTP